MCIRDRGNEAIANGVQFVGEVDGKWQMTINSEAGIRALQFLYDLNYGDGTRKDDSSGNLRQAFADGTIAFNCCLLYTSFVVKRRVNA